ncbi:MAG: helix-turn-helix domain-containing protein [Caulobacteraceae bacterium]
MTCHGKTNDIDAAVGAKLALWRSARQMTQKLLGQHLGISEGCVQQMESGKMRLHAAALIHAAITLEIQPGDLLP